MFGRGDGVKIKLSGNDYGTGVFSYHSFRIEITLFLRFAFTEMSSTY